MAAASSASSSPKKLRVLCLHGFRTNVQVMQSQTRGLREALGPDAEFVFLNGPFEARGRTDRIIERMFGDTAPFYEWWGARSLEKEEREDIEAEEGVPKGTTKRWCLEFDDIDRAIEYMDEKLNELGEFDLAVGFSQGSIMLTILSMWYLKKANKCWWKLVLCVCGVYPQGINVRELFETHEGQKILVPVPSIHVVGKKDSLYKDSLVLKDMYTPHAKGSPLERLLLEHDGGHKFPSPGRHQQFYADLANTIWKFFEDSRRSSVARL
ncbi:hypothetical protein PHYSODRAFT_469031 [Phytophthora sojae]|uniref:Serine hydrolase domain-containing protein n=1 Tax=Phytophthora sojae (strain P6497) TaxID=1094619 RepID=G4YL77_PHYSP|nr:hypothetical protein PHYSODRAFT_469031 [Phytophthora sojae]EGZ29992.1 hypothetical protein PHYSODRAFT_469031 [Phytophthora sojae]|eukprot:XP_009517267.1 hypothetical protein PHYSODRAFT_469031 [Phytophthora sojae]